MSRSMVEAERLGKAYHNGRIVALEEIDLRIETGEFVSILGPSGSGKTTLLNIIGALDRPTSGRVTVDGVDLSGVNHLDRFRAERVGFVFQLHNLISTLNAHENVQLPMYSLKIGSRERRERATELLEAVGLRHRAGHTPAMLSGGERQRVAIARALANNPGLVLGDEPTGTLDPKTGQDIIDLMQALNREQGTTLILVTHDPAVARRAHRIVHLVNGKIAERSDIWV